MELFQRKFIDQVRQNEEMEGITNIVKSLEESGLLIKETSKTIKNEPKEKKRRISSYFIRNISC